MRSPYFDKLILIELIKNQAPERNYLLEQLNHMESEGWIRQPYISLSHPNSLMQNRIPSEVYECIELDHAKEGMIILDLNKDGKILGIELVDQIHDRG